VAKLQPIQIENIGKTDTHITFRKFFTGDATSPWKFALAGICVKQSTLVNSKISKYGGVQATINYRFMPSLGANIYGGAYSTGYHSHGDYWYGFIGTNMEYLPLRFSISTIENLFELKGLTKINTLGRFRKKEATVHIGARLNFNPLPKFKFTVSARINFVAMLVENGLTYRI